MTLTEMNERLGDGEELYFRGISEAGLGLVQMNLIQIFRHTDLRVPCGGKYLMPR